jgi:hypothetical protein
MDIYDSLITRHASVKAVGVSFREMSDENGRSLTIGSALEFYPQPDNEFDVNALAVFSNGRQVGWVPAPVAARVAESPRLQGRVLHGAVSSVRHIPESLVSYELSINDGVSWVPAVSGVVVSDTARVAVRAVGDRGVMGVTGLAVSVFDGERRVSWGAPVAGFDFKIGTVGPVSVKSSVGVAS